MAPTTTQTTTERRWGVEFDTVRRESQFRHPPRDGSAFPALQAAVQPHIDSFNAVLAKDGLLEHGIRDIGTKVFLSGEPGDVERDRLSVRIRQIFVEKPYIPASNKVSTRNREIFPAECRQRNATYRGRMRVKLEYQINNESWNEMIRDVGQMPIMLRVCTYPSRSPSPAAREREPRGEC